MTYRFSELSRLCVMSLATLPLLALADPSATRFSPQEMATPRGALLAYDHWLVDLQNFDNYSTFYSATTDQEKACVQQCRKFDRVAATIERLSRQTFGAESCTAILHEFGEPDVPDLQAAVITINGTTALVHFAAVQADMQMVRVGDAWQVDTASLLRSGGGFDNAMQSYSTLTAQLQPVADGLQAGKYKTAQEVVHAIDQATSGPQK